MTGARLPTTPGQTVGPFFGCALPYPDDSALVPAGTPDAVRLTGRILDGAGDPVPDALIEIWQADPDGQIVQQAGSLRRDGTTFTGWGRAATDSTGRYGFTTLAPGPTDDTQVPFFALTLFARGVGTRLFTRAYLPRPAELLAADPLLSSLDPARRSTLLASHRGTDLVFDIRLQGPSETVFLHYPELRP
ncbi:protocatechuate 3,4-dioxygenase subunit alpha [Streptomyces sp. TR02-1]|uniref:protocatechuate 3,4-dioxygenase subunit alpha n=1 Tax=Streptomyces sp. TR02-1 TaxID=3385977 RepID=UPI00399F8324